MCFHQSHLFDQLMYLCGSLLEGSYKLLPSTSEKRLKACFFCARLQQRVDSVSNGFRPNTLLDPLLDLLRILYKHVQIMLPQTGPYQEPASRPLWQFNTSYEKSETLCVCKLRVTVCIKLINTKNSEVYRTI